MYIVGIYIVGKVSPTIIVTVAKISLSGFGDTVLQVTRLQLYMIITILTTVITVEAAMIYVFVDGRIIVL